jgi:hypothetical protein
MTVTRRARWREHCAIAVACSIVAMLLAACGEERADGPATAPAQAASREPAVTTSRPALSMRDAHLPAVQLAPVAQPADPATDDETPAYPEKMPQGINTDQSLPAHPVRGPTASWPPGTKHIH